MGKDVPAVQKRPRLQTDLAMLAFNGFLNLHDARSYNHRGIASAISFTEILSFMRLAQIPKDEREQLAYLIRASDRIWLRDHMKKQAAFLKNKSTQDI